MQWCSLFWGCSGSQNCPRAENRLKVTEVLLHLAMAWKQTQIQVCTANRMFFSRYHFWSLGDHYKMTQILQKTEHVRNKQAHFGKFASIKPMSSGSTPHMKIVRGMKAPCASHGSGEKWISSFNTSSSAGFAWFHKKKLNMGLEQDGALEGSYLQTWRKTKPWKVMTSFPSFRYDHILWTGQVNCHRPQISLMKGTGSHSFCSHIGIARSYAHNRF